MSTTAIHQVVKGATQLQTTENTNSTLHCAERGLPRPYQKNETQAHRVLEARKREDAFLENAVREGDVSMENKVENLWLLSRP